MKRATRMTAAAAVAVLSAAVGVSCGSKLGPPTVRDGVVRMALSLPSGVTINAVSYTIHSNQTANPSADQTGTINTANGMAIPSIDTIYPASTHDTVTMTASTSAGEPCTGIATPFPSCL